MAKIKTPANVIGAQVRKTRNGLGLTQEQLAARCQLHGLDISRGTLSQIEAQIRCVTDWELSMLAIILRVAIDELYPAEIRKKLRRTSPVKK